MRDASMEPLSLDQLLVLLTVVEEGSFSAAARRLRRAQSAVSYAIGNLERLLGVTLFDRQGRRPVLTDQGRALLGDVRAIAQQVEQLQARARRMSEGVEPQVSLAVDVLFPMPVLMETLDAFRAEFPQVGLLLHTEVLGGVAQRVADGVCQIGISGPLERYPAVLAERALTRVLMVTVAAAAHPLAALPQPVSTAELQRHTQLVLTDRSALTEGVDMAVMEGSQWRLADLDAKHSLLRSGFGWGNMPLHRVAGDLASGTLVRIQAAALPAEMLVAQVLLTRRARPPGPAGRWLIDRLEAAVAASCA